MIIALNAGHTLSGTGTGAVGKLNESKENREVTKRVKSMLEQLGHEVIDCTIDKSSNYLSEAVKKANAQKVDLALSIHFNSTKGAQGVEILVYSLNAAPKQAESTVFQIANLGFRNRGVKVRSDLYWLKKTSAPAMLVECCFVDDPDASKYNAQKMAEAIVKGVAGKLPSNPSGGGFVVGDYNKTVEVTASELSVRKGRGVTDKYGNENPVLGQLRKGDRVTIWSIDKAPDGGLWGSFRYNPDNIGYINMHYVKEI